MKSNLTNNIIEEHISLLKIDQEQICKKVKVFADEILKVFKKKNKILIFGNGGSAADSQHFATELTVRLAKNRIALPAIALTTDTSAITAISNDFHANDIFKRQIEALSNKGDLIIPISTSGNSKNILEAIKYSKKNKLRVFGILGNKGGQVKKYCSNSFIVSSSNSSRVQEIHIIFWQIACQIIENNY